MFFDNGDEADCWSDSWSEPVCCLLLYTVQMFVFKDIVVHDIKGVLLAIADLFRYLVQ